MPQPDPVLVDLAADNVAALGLGDLVRRVEPPYRVQFGIRREQWPAVRFLVEIAGQPVAVIDTTEPRLRVALGELMENLS